MATPSKGHLECGANDLSKEMAKTNCNNKWLNRTAKTKRNKTYQDTLGIIVASSWHRLVIISCHHLGIILTSYWHHRGLFVLLLVFSPRRSYGQTIESSSSIRGCPSRFAAYAGVPRVLQPCLSRFLLLAAATAAAATASAAAAPLRPIDQLRVNDQWLSAFGTVAFVE